MWQGGDVSGRRSERGELRRKNAPLQLDIKHDGAERWRLFARFDYYTYRPAWARRFIAGVQGAAAEMVFTPWAAAMPSAAV
mmetsp:Transcript_62632/g.116504  ORF Transcript_62632/g.116504 Transcript_62632/m.116504 type:complete len:81 (+) Transcript_62632:3-245(+)